MRILGGGSTSLPIEQGNILLIVIAFLILPVETLLGQAIPISLLKKCGLKDWVLLCLLSAVLFGLLHAPIGGRAFVVGFTGGLVLSHCWLSWRKSSVATAFWSTTAVHAAHNGVAALLLLAGMNNGVPHRDLPGTIGLPIPLPTQGVTTSSYSIESNSKGEMIVDASNVELGELLTFIFKHFAKTDGTVAPTVVGDPVVLKKKVSGRCSWHIRTEMVSQLQVIGSCVINVDQAGTRVTIRDARTK